jgi:glutamate-ammonia-ligase adenylyltransferase
MSEFLSKIFISHPELLDSLVARSSSAFVKNRQEMDAELTDLLAQAADFEEQLDILRRYRHEEFLRIGMNDIYGKLGQTEITTQLTCLADACLNIAFNIARIELSRFGQPTYLDCMGATQVANLAVLAMGKMGAFELNYHSDLDIIYIYDYQGITNGDKQITNHEYFAKLGQKIISVLTTQTREGFVYKIDTRLRPSGNAGPLVTSLESFKNYHRREAQLWERQALTKARVVLGEEVLRDSIAEIVRHTVYNSGLGAGDKEEIHRLRMRMENEIAKESAGSYNIKTGHGGIVDVEFVVQYLQLKHGKIFPEIRSPNTLVALKAMKACGIVTEQDAATLLDGYKFLRRLENMLRIIHDYSMNDLGGPVEYLNKLARRLGYDPRLKMPGNALMQDYEKITCAVRSVYQGILGA